MFYNKNLLMKEFENMNKQRELEKKLLNKKKDQAFIKNFRNILKQNQNAHNNRKWSLHGKNPKAACTDIQQQLRIMAN